MFSFGIIFQKLIDNKTSMCYYSKEETKKEVLSYG